MAFRKNEYIGWIFLLSYFVDYKYINLLSGKLEKFSWKKNNLAVCRCPMCGDSKKNRARTRFYFYQQKGKYFVKCHNCAYSSTFEKFLEKSDSGLYSDYRVESFQDSRRPVPSQPTIPPPVFSKKEVVFDGFLALASLPDKHPAKKYILDRKIPSRFLDSLYYAEHFNEFAGRVDPDKDCPKDSRIIIPMYDRAGNLFAVQGRSLNPESSLRYITVRYPDTNLPKIYGLNLLNDKKVNYCVEGPFDSMFLPNAIAMAGSSVAIDELPFFSENTVFVYDNEPRNKEIIHAMASVIAKGKKICIWPNWVEQKDINDMVLSGMDVVDVINANTYSDLMATLQLSKWRKV